MRFDKKSLTSLIVIFAVLLALVGVKVFNGDVDGDKPASLKIPDNDGQLVVHYLDVGQGDSAFIELPDGQCMLIDAAVSSYGDKIVETIEGYGYTEINYLVATHPHADHIGGMTDVVEGFEIGEVYMPKATSTSKTFEGLLTAISDKGLQINTAKADEIIYSDDETKIEILAPVSESYEETNNYSAVVKITYGKNSFLFTGDAEELSENEMLDECCDKLRSDVLKVGHHGSSSSTSDAFLTAVAPQYAVISCGADNSYGHPHKETIIRLNDMGIDYYRTDRNGTVTISCNGNDVFDIECENELDN